MKIIDNQAAPFAVYAQTEWHIDDSGIKFMKWINPRVYRFDLVPINLGWDRVSPRFTTESQATAYLPNIHN